MDEMGISQPEYGELAFSIIDELARSGTVDLVVVDSVSALVPRSEMEGDFGVQQVRIGRGSFLPGTTLNGVCITEQTSKDP
jgi:recombination protein RecA